MSKKTPDEEDFRGVSWQDEIDSTNQCTVESYTDLFFDKSEELEEEGDISASKAYRFLGSICSMYFKENEPDEPFGPMIVTSNGRSAALDDFLDEDLDLMSDLLEEVEDPDLKARITDILWTNRRNHKAAETAVETYLDSAENLLDHESWYIGFKRIKRAFEIATMLGNEDLRNTAEDFVLDKLDEIETGDSIFLINSSLELLLDHGLGDKKDLSQRSEEAAEFAESEGKWKKAKQHWMLKAKIERKREKEDQAVDAEIRAGEAIREQADVDRTRSHAAAVYHLADALEIFRRAGASEKAVSVHKLLLEDQEKSTEELSLVETEFDLTDAVTEAQEVVSDLELVDAFQAFAMITDPPKKQDLKKEAEGIVENNRTSALFPKTIVNEDGKTVAKRGSAIGTDAEENVVKAEMTRICQRQYCLKVHGLILPALEQITREHRVTLRDLIDLCQYNPIVPPGRECIFARGLYRGFQGDYISSSNILIPQIEHILRYLLKQNGVITSSLQSDGIQEELTLSRLLCMEETEHILGEDMFFTLNSLLNSKFGSNFRHRTAHGLLDDDQFGSAPGIYTWWLVLHLIFLPVVAASDAEKESSNEKQDEDAEDLEE